MNGRRRGAAGSAKRGPFEGLRPNFEFAGVRFELRVDRSGLRDEDDWFTIDADGQRARLTVSPDTEPAAGHAAALCLALAVIEHSGSYAGVRARLLRPPLSPEALRLYAAQLLGVLVEAGAWQGLERAGFERMFRSAGRADARRGASGDGGAWEGDD